jgi:hypothetical protein
MGVWDSCTQSRERQFTALHGALSDSAACRALQLARALVCSDCALAGASVALKTVTGRSYMKVEKVLITLTTGATFGLVVVIVAIGCLCGTSRALADDEGEGEHSKVRIGFEIAPVPLNLEGKNRQLVGLGSYFVNVLGNCNICHSAGPATEFMKGGNPYFKGSQPTVVNQVTYLGGGRVFPQQAPGAPLIVSRNLTPDKTGLPAGGRTFEEFRFIMQTGTDLDQVHPNCSDPTITASTACYPANLPFNGDLLQIMPWPGLRHLTEHELRAIYEYLSAVPCIAGPATGVRHNDCI